MPTVEQLQIVIDAQNRASAQLKRLQGELSGTQKQSGILGRAFGGLNSVAGAFGVTIGAAGVVLAAKSAITTFKTMDAAFTGVKKTVELTDTQFAELEETFEDMSRATGLSFEQLSRIGELAGQLGVSGKENIEKFTKTIADISVSTNLTEEVAATAFARIANVMQEPIENVDRMGATIVDLGNNFATTEADITEFSQRIAGAGQIAGLTTADVMGIGAAMSSVGIQAEAGGTAVQKVLINMNTAVVEGSEQMQTFAKTAGMSADEFGTLWEQDAGKAFEKFVIGLGTQGDDAINTLSDLGLQDQRLIRSFLSLAGAGDVVTKTMDTASDAWEENTALTVEAERRYGSASGQMDRMKESLRLVMKHIGAGIWKAFNFILEKMHDAWEALQPVVNILRDAMSRLRSEFGDDKQTLDILGQVLKWTFIILGAAIVVAVTSIIETIRFFVIIVKKAIAVVRTIINVFQTLNEINKKVAETIVNQWKWLWGILFGGSIIPDIINAFFSWFNRLYGVVGIVQGIIDSIGGIIWNIRGHIVQAFSDAISRVIGLFHTLWGTVMGIFSSIGGHVQSVVGRITSSISGAVGAIGGLLGRQHGGAVMAGRAYVVGEQGAELFVPGRSGSIIPNNKIGNNIEININNPQVRSDSDIDAIAKKVREVMSQELQLNRIGVS